jgi:uncharacterized membrane protein
LRLYHLLPAGFAFAVLVGIAASSAALAVLQDSRSLCHQRRDRRLSRADTRVTGSGDHVALFSFYAVLDAGILAVAYYKAHGGSSISSDSASHSSSVCCGARSATVPTLFASTEPFLILFFVFYVAIAVLYALRQAPRLAHYVDGTLIFGTPLIALGLQTALVRDMEFGAAWSRFRAGAFYLMLATVLHARQTAEPGLAGRIISCARHRFRHACRAACLRWPLDVCRIGQWKALPSYGLAFVRAAFSRAHSAWLLQVAASAAFLIDSGAASGTLPVLNSLYLGCIMISLRACSAADTSSSMRASAGEGKIRRRGAVHLGRAVVVWRRIHGNRPACARCLGLTCTRSSCFARARAACLVCYGSAAGITHAWSHWRCCR